jgi:tetratricopeptide (TPR) repeat protein
MTPTKLALFIMAGAALGATPAAVQAMGGGGSGAGGMVSSSPAQPAYDPVIEYQRGTAALQAGKYRDAVDAFQHVTDATPGVADAWLMLGMAKNGAGDVKGAEKAYERSVKLDGASVAAHRELALSLIKLKQPDKAGAELTTLKSQASACNDTCPDAADLKQAISAIEAALASGAPGPGAAATPAAGPAPLSLATPQQGDGAYVRAVSLINEQRFPEALASLDRAEAAIGPHPDILTYKGYVWRRMGDWAKAEGYYRQALAIAPEHRGATEYYGELKVLKGDAAGARAMLAKLERVCAFGCAEAEELRRWIDHGGDPAS